MRVCVFVSESTMIVTWLVEATDAVDVPSDELCAGLPPRSWGIGSVRGRNFAIAVKALDSAGAHTVPSSNQSLQQSKAHRREEKKEERYKQ